MCPGLASPRNKETDMRKIAVLAAVLFGGSLLLAQDSQKITVTAKKYEFSPSTIEVKAGQPVEITFQSEDTKHGFECKELGLEKVVFEKDKPETVTFTPEKPGTYEFKCARFCGMGHSKMKGQIVVTP
jgi:cytochrome c oxidase subunit 2